MSNLVAAAPKFGALPDNNEVGGGGVKIAAPDLIQRIIHILDPHTLNPRDPESWRVSPYAVKASRIVRMVGPFLK